MRLFVYSDESGVFDQANEEFFVFGGVIFLSKKDRDDQTRKYLKAERVMRNSGGYAGEMKASSISNVHKGSLYRSMNSVIKFGAIVHQKRVKKTIYESKKEKQRYQDYVFKITLKRALENLNASGATDLCKIEAIFITSDEHTTATDGRYELREGLLRELKYGTHNYNYQTFFPPICKTLSTLEVRFADSGKTVGIRMADIVANRIYYHAASRKLEKLDANILITHFP